MRTWMAVIALACAFSAQAAPKVAVDFAKANDKLVILGGASLDALQDYYHVQFGIPPETIKDSMRLGIPVPSVYVVPVDRFCSDMGPALGVNHAEFEFPSYFKQMNARFPHSARVANAPAALNEVLYVNGAPIQEDAARLRRMGTGFLHSQ